MTAVALSTDGMGNPDRARRRLLLIRHGATEANERGRFQGWSHAGLSEGGRAEVERTRNGLAGRAVPDLVVSSDLPRALETARLLFPDADLQTDRRLRELSFGAFEGRSHQELLEADSPGYRAWLDDPDGAPPPSGESLTDMRSRVLACWAEQGEVETVAVVTHGGPLGTLLAHLLQEGDPHAAAVPQPAGYVELLAEDEGTPRWRVIDTHLIPTPDICTLKNPDPRASTDESPRHPKAPVPKPRTPGPYPVPPRENRTGLVLLHTGNGKGKTTAALGILLRARGRDMSVAMLQFIKTEGNRRGEHIAAERLGVEIISTGGGFTWLSEHIEEDRALARKCWARCREALESGRYDIVIFDELTYALSYGWLTHDEVLPVIRGRPEGTHVVITGRNATPELVEFADLVTEMTEVKHPYRTLGVGAQPGLEL